MALVKANKISRYYHTLRYLKARQTFGRSYAELKRKFNLFQIPEIPAGLVNRLEHKLPFLNHDPWNERTRLLNKEFTFLNATKNFSERIDWISADMPLLWRFNLHYFNYLHLLNDTEKENICLDWIRNNPAGSSVGWHPYPLSLRIVSWSKQNFTDPEILRNLHIQASYLYRNSETYHPGNHLLENARALIFAGLLFKGQGEADKWLTRGLQILESEIPVQVLADGGYFERSTMYHAVMLENFLDIINVLPMEYLRLSGLEETAARMGDFLFSLTHPDGNISLFNDSTVEIAPPPEELLQYLRKLCGYSPALRPEFPQTGYFVHRSDDLCLIIDGGIIGPDYLPAHSHADIFSYELSVHDQQLITDTGVYEYAQGIMRQFVRSTRAHNTVSVDRLDQAECWSSFRLARRFPPKDVSFSMAKNKSIFRGHFDGYASLIGDNISHERLIDSDAGRRQITVKDIIKGEGNHRVESLINLHPSSGLKKEGNVYVIDRGGHSIKIVPVNGIPSVEEGWYCPQFGLKISRPVIVLSSSTVPSELSYRIEY